jgi:hypothetical protein
MVTERNGREGLEPLRSEASNNAYRFVSAEPDIASAAVIPGSPYMHFKGKVYIVHSQATSVDGNEDVPVVVYYAAADIEKFFVRTLADWNSQVMWSDGIVRPRFSRFVKPTIRIRHE